MESEIASARPRWPQRALLLLALLIAGAASFLSIRPPDVDLNTEFELAPAWKHLEFIAREPRPVGSSHHRAVREYLVAQLAALGLDVEVQEAYARHRRFLRGLPFQVRNVVARVRGTGSDSTTAVMLACHYDSTPLGGAASPGAGDDGAAVAALLEVARVLSRDPPTNDVIFLFTDGEEIALLGAQAFVDAHRWRDDVGVVLNFEARGTSGASIMFQTSHQNAAIIEHYARVAPQPVATSLSELVYRLMPNDTDFTVFRDAGYRGLNFAFIEDYANYHTAGDSIENLDPRSLLHHGAQALALARHFGQIDLQTLRGQRRDSIYFAPLPGVVIRYPGAWAIILGVAVAAAVLLVVLLGFQRGMIQRLALITGSAALVLSIALAVGLAWIVLKVSSHEWLSQNAKASVAVFAAISFLSTLLALWFLGRRQRGTSFAAAGFILWAFLAMISALAAPGASYLPAWPTLFAGLGLAGLIHRAPHVRPWEHVLWLLVGAVPVVMLLTPVLYLAFVGMRVQMAPIMCAAIVASLWLIVPQIQFVVDPNVEKEGSI